MKSLRLGLGLAAVGCLLACAGAPKLSFAWDHEARFDQMRVFAWYDDPTFQMPHGGSIVDGRFIDEHVRKAVEEHLREKGLERSADGSADIYVAYHAGTEGVVSQDRFGSYAWWSPTIYGGAKYRKEGSLVLDVRDGGKKLIWRGIITAIVGTNPDEVARDIDKAVGDLLARFPPPPGATAPAPAG